MEETDRPHADHEASRRPGDGRPSTSDEGARPVLLDRSFGRADITVVRHEVSDRLTAAGLPGDRLQGFLLAVNEVITNVVLHAGGDGRLRLTVTDGAVRCTVSDSGPGLPARFRSVPTVPDAFEVGGRGIWLAYQLCDEVGIEAGSDGTVIDLTIRVGDASRPDGLVDGASANR